ncbi:hypothetical protein GmHk_20G056826 [Glycine max]|nr:hypothetical protein GmHk_20G056826 [Glycine max]
MEYKDKPIITLLEGIRFYIRSKIVKLRTILMRYEAWWAHWCGDADLSLFEVSKGMEKFVVNLKKQKCSCRKWELTGSMVLNQNCVNSYYRKSTVLTTYSFIVYPCNEANLWPPLQTPVMLPPVMRRAPGRPKKARNKKNDEFTKRSNLARQAKLVVCKKCRKIGHKKRTCKGKTSADRSIPKGGNKNLKRQAPCPTPVVTKKQKNAFTTSQTTSVAHQGGDITNETQQSQIS